MNSVIGRKIFDLFFELIEKLAGASLHIVGNSGSLGGGGSCGRGVALGGNDLIPARQSGFELCQCLTEFSWVFGISTRSHGKILAVESAFDKPLSQSA